jgi:HSP20 family protein
MASSGKKQNIAVHRSKWVSVGHHQVHSVFDELIHKTWGHQHWHAAADVIETADDYIVEIDLPGVEPDNIGISLEESCLIVETLRQPHRPPDYKTHLIQRPIGRCYCSFEFPCRLDTASMSKSFENGVLTIRIPKGK